MNNVIRILFTVCFGNLGGNFKIYEGRTRTTNRQGKYPGMIMEQGKTERTKTGKEKKLEE